MWRHLQVLSAKSSRAHVTQHSQRAQCSSRHFIFHRTGAYVLSNPFQSKPSIVFAAQKPFYSQPNYSSLWLDVLLCAYFELSPSQSLVFDGPFKTKSFCTVVGVGVEVSRWTDRCSYYIFQGWYLAYRCHLGFWYCSLIVRRTKQFCGVAALGVLSSHKQVCALIFLFPASGSCRFMNDISSRSSV